jgi:hypothetical protein
VDVLQKREPKDVNLVEGAFNSMAIYDVALLGSTVRPRQAAWIGATGQTLIVMPNSDEADAKLINATPT